MKSLKFNRYLWGLIVILILAFFLRFINISWGLPYHFHPDEWNMASAITRLSLRNGLNPDFFAYGQFPLYLAFFSAKIYNLIPWLKITFIDIPEAIFFLRFWSALAGVGTVYLVYLISRRLFSSNYLSLTAALLAVFTPGLIQISHFGTTESLLSFFFLAILYFSLKILEKPKFKYFLWSGVFLGLALATKISALVFLSPLGLVSAILFFRNKNKLKIFGQFFISIVISLSLALFTSPYLLLKFQESLRILTYEARVAQGLQPVFYTRQFFNTIPVIFQLQKIFPHTLGWPIFIIGTFGFFIMLFSSIKNIFKSEKFSYLHFTCYLLLVTFVVYFLSQAFLFTKWTRFMAPVFAFFPIFAVYFFQQFTFLNKKFKALNTCLPAGMAYFLNLRANQALLILASIASIASGLLFASIYLRPDIRFTASEWIYKNIPSGSKVLSETGNVIDIPLPRRSPAERDEGGLTPYNLSPISFDFYHLDENPELFNQLLTYLETADYIFVPSRRIFANHQRLAIEFPKTAKYYELLFSGKLGFTEVKKFSPFLFSDEQAEETWSVFDHPVIRIYKKTKKFTKEDYSLPFKNDFI